MNRVPYFKMECIDSVGTSIDIAVPVQIDQNSIFAVTDATMELVDYKGFMVSVNAMATMEFYSNVANEDFMKTIFSPGSRWKISFGWKSKDQYDIIPDLDCILFNAKAEYTDKTDGFKINMVLFSALDDLLFNTPIELLQETKKLISSIIQEETNSRDNLTIYNILDSICNDLANIVSSNPAYKSFKREDVPTINDLLFCVTDSTVTSPQLTFERLIKNKIVNDISLLLILNDKSGANTYHWIKSILKDNGFFIAPALWKKGFKYLIFLPTAESEKYAEEEIKSSLSNNPRETVTHTTMYDLYDPDSTITEISLTTDGANKTKEEILAIAKLAEESSKFSQSDNTQDVDGKETLYSLYSIWQKTSKTASMTFIGDVKKFIWDNCFLKANNSIFDGTYKIFKLQHSITTSQFLTSVEMSRISENFISFRNEI
jgi:hypothetical protein